MNFGISTWYIFATSNLGYTNHLLKIIKMPSLELRKVSTLEILNILVGYGSFNILLKAIGVRDTYTFPSSSNSNTLYLGSKFMSTTFDKFS
jgi:hypothetical protein